MSPITTASAIGYERASAVVDIEYTTTTSNVIVENRGYHSPLSPRLRLPMSLYVFSSLSLYLEFRWRSFCRTVRVVTFLVGPY